MAKVIGLQHDGVSMGSPLAPKALSRAVIMLLNHETRVMIFVFLLFHMCLPSCSLLTKSCTLDNTC